MNGNSRTGLHMLRSCCSDLTNEFWERWEFNSIGYWKNVSKNTDWWESWNTVKWDSQVKKCGNVRKYLPYLQMLFVQLVTWGKCNRESAFATSHDGEINFHWCNKSWTLTLFPVVFIYDGWMILSFSWLTWITLALPDSLARNLESWAVSLQPKSDFKHTFSSLTSKMKF